MTNLASRTALAVLLCSASTPILAQQFSPAAAPAEAPTVESRPAEQPRTFRLPALTKVELTVLDEVSSKTAINGQLVKLALAGPLYITPEYGLPAGTAVAGYVIHAAKGGMGGKAGELLLGAREIRLSDSVNIPLRSFKLGPAKGRNNETLAFATGVAVGLPALLINGGSAKVPAGTIANAKTGTALDIPLSLLSRLPPMTSASSAVPPMPAHATNTIDNATNGGNK